MKSIVFVFLLSLTLQAGCIKSGLPADGLDPELEAQLDKLAAVMSSSMLQSRKTGIAVMAFRDLNGHVTHVGKYIADELTARLLSVGGFSVVERSLVSKFSQEQQLNMTAAVDKKTVRRAMTVLKVDTIATGTVMDLGNTIRINASLMETSRGSVFSAAFADVSINDQIAKLLAAGTTVP